MYIHFVNKFFYKTQKKPDFDGIFSTTCYNTDFCGIYKMNIFNFKYLQKEYFDLSIKEEETFSQNKSTFLIIIGYW